MENENPVFILNDDNYNDEILKSDFSQNGYNLLSLTNDNLKVWDLRKSGIVFEKKCSNIQDAKFSNSGNLISLTYKNYIEVIDSKGKLISDDILMIKEMDNCLSINEVNVICDNKNENYIGSFINNNELIAITNCGLIKNFKNQKWEWKYFTIKPFYNMNNIK